MDDDDKGKETPPPTPPENDPPTPPTPPDPPSNDNDGLREEVSELKGIVTGLVEAVAALAPLPGDQTPTPVPWTHKRF